MRANKTGKQGNYVRMLFVDYSSAFNTIVPCRLFTKLRDLGLNSRLCAWVLDFLTGRTQVVRVGRCVSNSITINTGAPQGCVLSPLLYSLYTSDCVITHGSNTIVKFADDTVVLGAISNNDEAAYMDEVKNLASWCQDNHLQLNVAFDLRNRSDINKENSSPQSTVIPFVRVPSNCRRDFSLLMFDPDGDQVKCRYGNSSLSECNGCDPPSVLSLSSSTCTLSFGPTADSNVGSYGVQLLMEDFPMKNITMTGVNGTNTTQTPNDALSKVPIQFVLIVDPQVSSCTEGDFLPKFLPPTPNNRARLYTPVDKTLEISISAEAQNSTISELLFSGPYDAIQNKTGPGKFTLTWTPSKSQDNDTLPFCFVVQALSKETKYHSDLRCVSVTVGNSPVSSAPASASAFVLVMGSFLSTLVLALPSI
ncbi:integrin beta-like protein B [Neolamprologus brichardi]|uniref:integrin beta-like protein B n=1 Tax=Neolamprologus brichardi TaxID=32507 RepID=UPI001643AAD4|nr:integrin beta-like protein B [Neolamprologus brichardi]